MITADDVISALLAQLPSVPALANVAIVDGPAMPSGAMPSKDRLFIGASGDPRGTAAEAPDLESSLPGVIYIESFSIACLAEAWSGDSAPSARRARVFAIREAVRTAIHPTSAMIVLGIPGLSSARLGAWNLLQMQTEKGFYAGLEFRIECEARPATQ